MSWASIIVTILKLILTGMSWLKDRDLMKAGEDTAVAKAALEVLDATTEGQRLRNMLAMHDDAEAEMLWNRMLNE
jgi:hypothetical protein